MTPKEKLEALAKEYQDASESRMLRDGEKVLAKGCSARIRAILAEWDEPGRKDLREQVGKWLYEHRSYGGRLAWGEIASVAKAVWIYDADQILALLPDSTPPAPSAEYLHACGRPVTRMMDGPLHEYVDAGYVSWLEAELTRARENAGGKRNV